MCGFPECDCNLNIDCLGFQRINRWRLLCNALILQCVLCIGQEPYTVFLFQNFQNYNRHIPVAGNITRDHIFNFMLFNDKRYT
jgi:hypothetical protein